MIKDRKSFFFFFLLLCSPPVASVSSLSPPLLTSHSLHHLLFISLHLSAEPGRPYVFAHSHTHTLTATLKEVTPTHTCAPVPPSLVRFGGIAAFFFILKDLGSGDAVMSSSVSAEPSRPGRLDYISALVRPGDVFTRIINFISCPSIHPYVQLQLYP